MPFYAFYPIFKLYLFILIPTSPEIWIKTYASSFTTVPWTYLCEKLNQNGNYKREVVTQPPCTSDVQKKVWAEGRNCCGMARGHQELHYIALLDARHDWYHAIKFLYHLEPPLEQTPHKFSDFAAASNRWTVGVRNAQAIETYLWQN